MNFRKIVNIVILASSGASAFYFHMNMPKYKRHTTQFSFATQTPTPQIPKEVTPSVMQPVIPTVAPTTMPFIQPILETQKKLMWGAEFPNWEPTEIAKFETLVEKPIDIYATFVHWGNERDFPLLYKDTVAAKGKTLLIYWEAKDYNIDSPNQPQFNYDSILSGRWDSYFTQFAKDAKTYGGTVILAPFNEANDNSGPWGGQINGNTIEKHKSAFAYVKNFFNDTPNVKFAWAMNNVSSPQTQENAIENYYPGDSAVDYIGVDGFNFGNPWQNWDQVFGNTLIKLSRYNKPILITSTGSASGPDKPEWIRNGFGVEIKKYPLVIGWVWFNEQKEKDWRVNSDEASLAAFKTILP